jgi:hypothetical protein
VKYVGHVVSEAGVEVDPAKTEKVVNWPKPTNPEDVRRFLGFVGYYRRFIRQFSHISKPLTDLMPNPTPKKSKKHQQKPWQWGDEQDIAFETLKQQLISAPILGYANFELPFEIHTDASGTALGAVLYQEQDGFKKVISYASRGLTKSEKHYPPHKLEFLALKWAVCDKFKDYLHVYGTKFTVLTDNNPMTYVLTTAKLDATGHRWLAALAAFNFNILYRPGNKNGDADGLSRIPQTYSNSDNRETISIESVQAICNSILPKAYIENLAVNPDIVPSLEEDTQDDDIIDWVKAQAMDPVIKPFIKYVRERRKPKAADVGPTPLLRQFSHLRLVDDVLYREVIIGEDRKRQLVLPTAHIQTILEALHDDMGHLGKDRMLSLIRDRFYWPGIDKAVEEWISQC